MKHYVMVGEGVHPSRSIRETPDLPGSWMLGDKVTYPDPMPTPLDYVLAKRRPGEPKALYDEESFPVMRDDLVEALEAAGVDNLQLWQARLIDPDTGDAYDNYKAFNIIGLVSAADMDKSELMGTSDSRMIDTDFDALVIDEKKAGNLKLFRLAENISAIVVDESVRTEIEKRGIPGIVFYGPGEWAG